MELNPQRGGVRGAEAPPTWLRAGCLRGHSGNLPAIPSTYLGNEALQTDGGNCVGLPSTMTRRDRRAPLKNDGGMRL